MKMKVKELVKFGVLVVIILFFSLYFTTMSGYYEINQSRKSTLTQEAIEKFENDVAEGKEIIAKNYLEEEVDYNNKASKIGLRLSNYIEKSFNKMMNAIFRVVEKTVNENN